MHACVYELMISIVGKNVNSPYLRLKSNNNILQVWKMLFKQNKKHR
jgi:hypothetical protein